jgi:D-glucosaminate-6-phosphate ammonia-lyase
MTGLRLPAGRRATFVPPGPDCRYDRAMGTIYERLGIRTIINAQGPATRLSGGIMPPEVAQAMVEASQHCVDIAELQAAASRIIAAATGAEAGLVTSGAAAGLMLGTAACVTGLDPGKMNRLPDTAGMKDEVIVARSQRNFYDHAVRAAGVRLVEIGIADRFSGAGVRDCEGWEIATAITQQTAAILHVATEWSRPILAETVAAAHARGVPVLVDAAAQLPPVGNLRRFIAEGADLVVFSGGKALRGPQASGILCGRRDLVAAAALQMLDQDTRPELWLPPADFIDRSKLPGAPQHGIGRACKVGKEEIVGLLTALRLFIAEDPAARRARWRALMGGLATALEGLPNCRVALVADAGHDDMPLVDVTLDRRASNRSALELARDLQAGEPAIYVNAARLDDGILRFGPMCLQDADPPRIAARLRTLLAGG